MRPVQAWARAHRTRFFLPFIKSGDRVLEAGSGDGWFRREVETALPVNYTTIDIDAPADIHGDIREWRQHGLAAGSFDVVVAFEIVEHTACFAECFELLKPGGLMLITTPMPHADWVLKILERLQLTQQRTSPHDHLIYLKTVPDFLRVKVRNPWGLGQWATLKKPPA